MNQYTLILTANEAQSIVNLVSNVPINQGLDLYLKLKEQIEAQESEQKNAGE